jgi:hypothetical protein
VAVVLKHLIGLKLGFWTLEGSGRTWLSERFGNAAFASRTADEK